VQHSSGTCWNFFKILTPAIANKGGTVTVLNDTRIKYMEITLENYRNAGWDRYDNIRLTRMTSTSYDYAGVQWIALRKGGATAPPV
jgi:hypothetical protein